jgi:hypothetical protein
MPLQLQMAIQVLVDEDAEEIAREQPAIACEARQSRHQRRRPVVRADVPEGSFRSKLREGVPS